MNAIIAALVSGGLALLGVIITVNASQRKTEAAIKTDLAVMHNEVQNLRKEVEKHNNFATKIPALEAKERANENAIKRLENFHME
jgi:uncharacterized membrane-anchored protein YhcB (DUF1043 family)